MIAPHRIDENAVYDLQAARSALALTKGTLPREIKLGRLRAAKRAGKYLILGRWLREWIEAGEVPRRAARLATADNGTERVA